VRASFRTTYGLPEVLSIKDLAKPHAGDDDVLIRVYATTVNRSDYHVLTGKPFFMKLFTGIRSPKLSITGSDFAGQVEAVGKDVKRFKVGDKVMGFIDMGAQSHAEYLAMAESKVTFAPSNLTYEETAACLEGAFYALCAIQPIKFQTGQTALVIGATGAIGSSYVQFLSHYGVDVTAVCGGEFSYLVQSLGASRIIDYKKDDFRTITDRYDFVFDAVGKYTFGGCKHLLKDNGAYTSSHPNIFLALITPLLGGKKELFAIPKDVIKILNVIGDLAERGRFVPVIDRKYPLEKIAAAYTYVGSGQKIGNVVITI